MSVRKPKFPVRKRGDSSKETDRLRRGIHQEGSYSRKELLERRPVTQEIVEKAPGVAPGAFDFLNEDRLASTLLNVPFSCSRLENSLTHDGRRNALER